MSKRQERSRAKKGPYLLRDRKTRSELTQTVSETTKASSLTGATSGEPPGETVAEGAFLRSTSLREPTDYTQPSAAEKDDMAPPVTDMVSHSEFVKITDKIIEKLDLLNANVTSIHKEIAEIRANMTDLQAAVADSSARLTDIENDALPKLRKRNENLETDLTQKLMALELHDRKMNLLIYGVEKKKDEKVVQVVRNVIEELGFSKEEVEKIFFANAHRLPRRIVTQGNERNAGRGQTGHDPIIVRFLAMMDRDSVLNAYQQRARMRPVTIEGQAAARPTTRFVTDLPAPLKRKRFMLEQQAYQMRKNENKSTRIKLIGTSLQLECREKGNFNSPWRAVIG